MNQRSLERPLTTSIPGIPMLVLGILLLLSIIGVILIAVAADDARNETAAVAWGLSTIPLLIAGILVLRGLILVNPNQSKVVLLFGKYIGTERRDGFWWVNPFTVRRSVSLRVHNFNSDTLKVNDLRGNPVEIGAVVVWRVKSRRREAVVRGRRLRARTSSRAKSEAAHPQRWRRSIPYDTPMSTSEMSLRGNTGEVNAEQLQKSEVAGAPGPRPASTCSKHASTTWPTRPEIAGGDAPAASRPKRHHRRARQRIVEGAVGMVEDRPWTMLAEPEHSSTLDDERKASMVSNLLVVLCSEHDAAPVINAGSLYN